MSGVRWEAAWDAKHDRWFYQDRHSNMSSWDKPAGVNFDLPTQPPSLSQASVRPDPERCPPGWEAQWDPTHSRWYYFNRITEERKWSFKPKEEKKLAPRTEEQPAVTRASSSGQGAAGSRQQAPSDRSGVNRLPSPGRGRASSPGRLRDSSPGRGLGGRQRQDRSSVSSEWDHEDFLRRLTQAKATGEIPQIKRVLVDVSENNYVLRDKWRPLPRTVAVTNADCLRLQSQLQPRGRGREAQVSFSCETTADAIISCARRGGVVCALNFANGVHVGGGYKNGAIAQEEDLCRRCPTLYTSLNFAKRDGHYPFGPSTCRSVSQPEKYHNVLYTRGIVVARGGEETGYKLLPQGEQVMCSLVTAAAPNLKGGELFDKDLLYKAVQSIFIAPVADDRRVNTLILGAWGCGVFGCDPRQIAELFVQAIKRDRLGELYERIVFAIPSFGMRQGDSNLDVFKRTLREHRINFTEASF